MPGYVFRRILVAVIAFFVISIIIFSIIWIFYEPPLYTFPVNTTHTPEQIEELTKLLEKELGLGQIPFHIAYSRWMGGFLTGDWGESFMPASYYAQ